jgi:hypothetical protein
MDTGRNVDTKQNCIVNFLQDVQNIVSASKENHISGAKQIKEIKI